ncbi:transposase [Streptomyces sp. H27-H1]|uniref:transposase n=1 Tax=Streptomyces sp. H27-H1 TaxID=2996461 RepID=UPI00226D8C99|nr:transposase [Streptomyces sp. H27-H1]MCY0932538.1 transposase [Streptomyces sp. H27-H1]
MLVCADPHLREALAGLTNSTLIARCAELADPASPGVALPVELTLRLLARRVQSLTEEIRQFGRLIRQRVQDTAPDLLELHGVGPDSAAALLVAAGDNPQRFHSEASFAALCGVSPVERSSGKSQRRRLNRGGDRQANAALFRIALTRLRDHPETRAYLVRRTAEGRTRREIIRCLKRYLARKIFKIVSTSIATRTA